MQNPLRRAMQQLVKWALADDPPAWISSGLQSYAGNVVTAETLGTLPAFYACRRAVAEDCASLPLPVIEQQGRNRRRATDHPVHRLVHDQPNPYMTAMVLREALLMHAITVGNGYAMLEWDRAFRLKGIWPLRSDLVRTVFERGVKRHYVRTESGEERPYEDWEIIHVPGPGFDGITGQSMVDVLLQAGGIGLAQQEFRGRFYSNASTPSGVLEAPNRLSDVAYARLAAAAEKHEGLKSAHRRLILEEGTKWHQTAVDPEKAQLVESSQFQVVDVARVFRMPLHKIQDLTHATFSNIEHQGIDYVVSCLGPWLVRLEQEFNRKLFSVEQTGRFYVKHKVEGLLRGDVKTRYEAYGVARQWGWLNADEIRELEDMNELPDGQGKVYLSPSNMVPADTLYDEPEPEVDPEPAPAVDSDDEPRAAFDLMLEDALSRVVRRERKALERMAPRLGEPGGLAAFDLWAGAFYGDHARLVERDVETVVAAFAKLIPSVAAVRTVLPRAIAQNWVADSRAFLTERAPTGDLDLGQHGWWARRAAESARANVDAVFVPQKRAA